MLKIIVIVILSISFSGTAYGDPCANTKKDWIPNPKGCNWTYRCSNGKVIGEYPCAQGKLFDADREVCTSSQTVACSFDRDSLSVCPPEGTHLYPHDYSCRKYFQCDQGVLTKQICEVDEAFSPIKKTCMPEEEAECTAEQSLICPTLTRSDDIAFVTSKLDCSTYYICLQSRVVKKTCAEGLYYDEESKRCDFAKKVGCRVSFL
jgi:hypothetical protein